MQGVAQNAARGVFAFMQRRLWRPSAMPSTCVCVYKTASTAARSTLLNDRILRSKSARLLIAFMHMRALSFLIHTQCERRGGVSRWKRRGE